MTGRSSNTVIMGAEPGDYSLGNATKFSIDNAGRVVLISEPLGYTTGMTCDNRDRIKQIFDARTRLPPYLCAMAHQVGQRPGTT
jgi:YD repeat-containing protein